MTQNGRRRTSGQHATGVKTVFDASAATEHVELLPASLTILRHYGGNGRRWTRQSHPGVGVNDRNTLAGASRGRLLKVQMTNVGDTGVDV